MRRLGLAGAITMLAQALKREPNAIEPPPPMPLWNSLEKSRIAVGVLTPISVAALGVVVAMTTSREQRALEESHFNQTVEREDQARRAELERENQRYQQGLQKDAAVRREARLEREAAFRREQYLNEQAFRRQLALQQRAEEREDEIRDEERARARAESLHRSRHELWQNIRTSSLELLEKAEALLATPETDRDIAMIEEIVGDAGSLVSSLGGRSALQLSPEFVRAMTQFSSHAVIFAVDPSRENMSRLRTRYRALEAEAERRLTPPAVIEDLIDSAVERIQEDQQEQRSERE